MWTRGQQHTWLQCQGCAQDFAGFKLGFSHGGRTTIFGPEATVSQFGPKRSWTRRFFSCCRSRSTSKSSSSSRRQPPLPPTDHISSTLGRDNDEHGRLNLLFCCQFSLRSLYASQAWPSRSGSAHAMMSVMKFVLCVFYSVCGLEGPCFCIQLSASRSLCSRLMGAFSCVLFKRFLFAQRFK